MSQSRIDELQSENERLHALLQANQGPIVQLKNLLLVWQRDGLIIPSDYDEAKKLVERINFEERW